MRQKDTPKKVKRPFNPNQRPQSVKDVFRKFGALSSVRGLGRICKARNPVLSALWALTILVFFWLSIYQVTQLILNYLRFESRQEQKIQIPTTMPFPDVTLCSLQPFRRQGAMEEMGRISDVETLVLEYFNNVTSKLDQYQAAAKRRKRSSPVKDPRGSISTPSGSQGTLLEKSSNPSVTRETRESGQDVDIATLKKVLLTTAALYQNMNNSMQLELGHQRSMIDHCQYTCQVGRRLITEMCNFKIFQHPQYFNCFTISKKHKEGNALELSLQLFLDDEVHLFFPEHYITDKDSQLHGVKVIIHEPNSFPDVGRKGLDVPPGMSANFFLATTEWKHQTPPYGQCDKDKTHTQVRTFDGKIYRYGKAACEDQCVQEHINQECKCVDPWLVGPRNLTDGLPNCVDITASLEKLQERVACMYNFRLRPPRSCSCPLPCTRFEYTLTETMSKWPHESFHLPLYSRVKDNRKMVIDALEKVLDAKRVFKNSSNHLAESKVVQDIIKSRIRLMDTDKFQRNFVSVAIKKETFEVNVLEEKPDISMAALMSSVGGILSFWLGLTLITVMELVEMGYDFVVLGLGKNGQSEKGEDDNSKKHGMKDTNDYDLVANDPSVNS